MNANQRRKVRRAEISDRKNGKITTAISENHVDRFLFTLWKLKLSESRFAFNGLYSAVMRNRMIGRNHV